LKAQIKGKLIAEWEQSISYLNRPVSFRGSHLDVVEYEFQVPSKSGLPGKKIMFFSDLHWNDDCPLWKDELKEVINSSAVDWLIYGGDLVCYSCYLNLAMRFMGDLRAERAKLAVYGNWDKRRRRWFPSDRWREFYRQAGFQLLVNESFTDGGLYINGTDDYKSGEPETVLAADECDFSVMVSHNPDFIGDCSDRELLSAYNLILCGHTHGGQIRFPFWGALKTSSKYWKKFEYGLYSLKDSQLKMIVSSCVGTSFVPIRFFCRPEVILIKLV
jgi:predicted MPP superfamily phosphohydrolase